MKTIMPMPMFVWSVSVPYIGQLVPCEQAVEMMSVSALLNR